MEIHKMEPQRHSGREKHRENVMKLSAAVPLWFKLLPNTKKMNK
jgi:hypothetical protein